MKKIYLLLTLIVVCAYTVVAQVVTTNSNPVGMEHNVLFNAVDRYTVTQTGSATLDETSLFDGKFSPSTTLTAPSTGDPTVILIEGLPSAHTQQGAWVGWSSRVRYPTKFLIEGYDIYYGNGWTTLADYSSGGYSSNNFSVKMTAGSYSKLRFTFYEASGTDGTMQITELFYLHPEATTPYNGLFGSATSTWDNNGDDIYYDNGNVGIGTTSPNGNLDVSSSSTPIVYIQSLASSSQDAILNIRGSRTTSTTSDIAQIILGSNDATGGDLAYITARKATGSTNEGNLLFWTTTSNGNSPTEKMRIDKDGNVGIGTNTPEGKLHVKDGKIVVSHASSSNQLEFLDDVDQDYFTFVHHRSGDYLYLMSNTTDKIIKFQKDGAVGIGTNSIPLEYKLAVDGKIICEEVKVEVSENWADFVFEPDYNLMSLKELDSFIQENKHLPEIPTTQEVEENGISVGEMNAKLLQKIEELTLYMIEMKKENEELKIRVEQLEISSK